jgi:dUTP pyrophosphatase
MINLKVKKLTSSAVLPTKAYEYDAGFDLTVDSYEVTHSTKRVCYHTGIAVEIPKGMVGLLFPRSSVYKKRGFRLTNSVGVIDSGYHGEVMAYFEYVNLNEIYQVGERFCQLVLVKLPEIEIEEVEELSDSERGDKGYGSSGN